jgi:hypothetical protein
LLLFGAPSVAYKIAQVLFVALRGWYGASEVMEAFELNEINEI